jgi:hypothetical protein
VDNNENLEDIEEEINNIKDELKELKMQLSMQRQLNGNLNSGPESNMLPAQAANYSNFFRNLGSNIARMAFDEKVNERKMIYKMASGYVQNFLKEGNYIGDFLSTDQEENRTLTGKTSKTMMINWEV